MIEDSVVPNSEAAADATLTDVSSVRVTGVVGRERLTGNESALQEEEHELVEVASGLDGQQLATVAGAVAVAAPEQVGDDITVKME